MKFFFADDSKNNSPSRYKMGPLVGVGGFWIGHTELQPLETALSALCKEFGFPQDPVLSEFKWSPGKDKWMRDNLIKDRRSDFFHRALQLAKDHGAKAMVMIEDTKCKCANKSFTNHEHDVAVMFIERVQLRLSEERDNGIIIIDRHDSNMRYEDKFLYSCIDVIQDGTRFVQFTNIAINVLCCPSKFVRLIQLADLITGCVVSYVGGEDKYAPETFEHIKPILYKNGSACGGYGIKLHPDFKYANLYHWLLGDVDHKGYPLPISDRGYAKDSGLGTKPGAAPGNAS